MLRKILEGAKPSLPENPGHGVTANGDGTPVAPDFSEPTEGDSIDMIGKIMQSLASSKTPPKKGEGEGDSAEGEEKKADQDREALKEAIKELMENEELEFTLPDATLQDGLRRNRECVVEIVGDVAPIDPDRPVATPNPTSPSLDEEKVKTIIDEKVKALVDQISAKRILKTSVLVDGVQVNTGIQHKQFDQLLLIVRSGLNAYLVGPAGSGKTTAAQQVAKCLGVKFYFTGAITSEFKLTGFTDANGKVVRTPFREAYEHGGVFLFDEIDGSMPQAVLAFNAAIANGMMDFPDRTVEKHEKFYCVAAANTFGMGADRVYVGRNQMDGATIDRFAFLDWEYDDALERAIAGNDAWVNYIQAVRKEVASHKVRHVVSPRASKDGARLLANGMPREKVEEIVLWKGLDKDAIAKIKSTLPEVAISNAKPPKAKGPLLQPETDTQRRAKRFNKDYSNMTGAPN